MTGTTGAAADECAQRVLVECERKSPTFTAAVAGKPREIVLALMAICFIDGSLHGAADMAAVIGRPKDPSA